MTEESDKKIDGVPENKKNNPLGTPEETNESTSQEPALPVPVRGVDQYVANFQQFAERTAERFDVLSNYIAPKNTEEELSPENIARTSIVFGMFTLILLFGILGLWSVLAPIDSAAIASGKVALDSNKKTIQHLEGGIVEEILVTEGMHVKRGQPLVRLDDTAAKARMDLYRGQFIAARATEARLIAERDGTESVSFSDALLRIEKEDEEVAANLDSQRRLFKSRKESVQGQIDVLGQQIKQRGEEINGLEKQIKSADDQIDLLNEEIDVVRMLLEKGNAVKPRLLSLERNAAQIEGQRGEQQSMIARAEQSINEAKIQMFNVKTEMLNQVVQELKNTQVELSDLEEKLRTAEDVVNRIVVEAPISGEITGLAVHTKGGVIAPGERLMDIVPFDDKLIVEARVSPQDIDIVRPGLIARVRLLAYKVRNVPPVEGTVAIISADRFEDDRTGETYYIARVEIPEEQLTALGEDIVLTPGMPTEVLIVTGSRSLFSYLMSPISDSFNRSFREQ